MQDCKLLNSHILCEVVIALGEEDPREHPDYLTREMPDGLRVLIKPCKYSKKFCSALDPNFKHELTPKPKPEESSNQPEPEPELTMMPIRP